MGRTTSAAGASGPLGPALAEAIAEYNAALARLAEAEGALATAQREAGEARGRLAALATGARVTGAKALVPVADEPCDEDHPSP